MTTNKVFIESVFIYLSVFISKSAEAGTVLKMSLLNFFKFKEKSKETQNESESRKRKAEDPVESKNKKQKQCLDSKKDKKYDATRERKFVESWLDDFDWLVYEKENNLMFCKYCRQYPKLAVTKLNQTCVFVVGSRIFRIEPIRIHSKSTAHRNCAAQFMRDEEKSSSGDRVQIPSSNPVKDTDIGKAFLKLGEKERQRMKFVFNCAYSIAYHNKPFTDMKMLCTLMKKNDVDIGDNYDNDVRAREFVSSIAECIQLDAVHEILNSPYVSILADGSTDVSFKEQKIVYVRYISNGEAKTHFISLEELRSSDAKGVKEGIDAGLERFGIEFSDLTNTRNEKPTLVCANFDGASVMQGLKTGTMAMILKDAPWVFPMHCVAHKLELAALDSVRADSYMRKFEEIVKGIYMFYHYSPKRRREVKEVADFLGSELVHISGIKQVRWLASRTRALTALRQNYRSIVAHLEHVATRNNSEEAARAKGYLRGMTSIKFVTLLYAMVDILEVTSSLSKVFQRSNLLVSEVYPETEIHLIKLEELKHKSGQNLQKFEAEFCPEKKSLHGVELTGEIPSRGFIDDIIDDLIHYIDKRFSNFNEEPLKCFAALNYKAVPQNRTDLMKFGNKDIETLLDHMPQFFPKDCHRIVLSEYTDLKVYMRELSQTGHESNEIYQVLLRKTNIPNVKKLIEILLVISPTTAECERGFSAMKQVKTQLRNCIKQDTLQMLMTVQQHGPTLEKFSPEKAVSHWLNGGKGTRHVNGHSKKCYVTKL